MKLNTVCPSKTLGNSKIFIIISRVYWLYHNLSLSKFQWRFVKAIRTKKCWNV